MEYTGMKYQTELPATTIVKAASMAHLMPLKTHKNRRNNKKNKVLAATGTILPPISKKVSSGSIAHVSHDYGNVKSSNSKPNGGGTGGDDHEVVVFEEKPAIVTSDEDLYQSDFNSSSTSNKYRESRLSDTQNFGDL